MGSVERVVEIEAKTPFYVHCRSCGHQWAAFYTPLTMNKEGRDLLASAAHGPCPRCAGKRIYIGSRREAG